MLDRHQLLQRTLRANPLYKVVLADRLSAERRAAAAALGGADFFAVLEPPATSPLPLRAIDREAALLFFTLQTPGPLPAYVLETFGESAVADVTRLLVDRVIEAEVGGRFMSGAEALGPPERSARARDEGRLAALARDALRHGARSQETDVTTLAVRLYHFNRQPLTPRWQRELGPPAGLTAFLGLENLLGHRNAWRPNPLAGWQCWTTRRAGGDPGTSRRYKLYLSPALADLPRTLAAVFRSPALDRARAFKIGADLPGLLRPDKFVAYFDSFEALHDSGGALLAQLTGLRPQGVPFTAELGADGLLSWGIDPPAAAGLGIFGLRQSWRLWIVGQLARSLAANPALTGDQAVQSALDRLELNGVDISTWAPRSLLFQGSEP